VEVLARYQATGTTEITGRELAAQLDPPATTQGHCIVGDGRLTWQLRAGTSHVVI
jgi:hypothetical protein